jgi:large subunit ribosomal protein L24
MKTTIKTGDTVKVISGDHKGKTAKIVKVAPRENKAFLEGIGLKTRHIRPTPHQKSGKKDIHIGIHLSNLKLEKSAESTKPSIKKGAKK